MNRIALSDRSLSDLECLITGAFAPLQGFMVESQWRACCETMYLKDGSFFPLPITLPINLQLIGKLKIHDNIVLTTLTNLPIAEMCVESIWEPDIAFECQHAYGTTDTHHPYVAVLTTLFKNKKYMRYVGGKITKVINAIPHYDFQELRLTCKQVKAVFKAKGYKTIIGFQTRNPMHQCHFALTQYALKHCTDQNTLLFINPVVGPTQPGDVPYFTRVRCYKHILKRYHAKKQDVMLSLLPLAMRMAGPREACLHALIRKNYGCTHFIVGRDHAGPSTKRADGQSFYEPYAAQRLLKAKADDIGITAIISKMLVYDPDTKTYGTNYENGIRLSGTKLRSMLKHNELIPSWFSFPEIVDELRKSIVKRGVCVYFVGLSGAGKTTLANELETLIRAKIAGSEVTILDGDEARHHLSRGLGFSRIDRSLNVRRIGFVAAKIVRHGGIVLCANIAPYEEDRLANRQRIEGFGGTYIEVYVNTPLYVCEARDIKGLYKKARAGEIKQFTGISDPFEVPKAPEFRTWGRKNSEILEDLVACVRKHVIV